MGPNSVEIKLGQITVMHLIKNTPLDILYIFENMKIEQNKQFKEFKFQTPRLKEGAGRRAKRKRQHSNTFTSHIFTKNKTLYKKYTSHKRPSAHEKNLHNADHHFRVRTDEIQYTHKAELWCCD